MSSTTDYNSLLGEIQAISPENVITANIPIDVFVQEAENLYHWSIDDQQALTRTGLDWNLVLSLPVRSGQLATHGVTRSHPVSNQKHAETPGRTTSLLAGRLPDRQDNEKTRRTTRISAGR